MLRFSFAFLASCVTAVPVFAQDDVSYPSEFDEPMPLYEEALGDFTRPISSANSEAQAYFDQGFQLMYAFAKEAAARSFREAWKRDPNCAACYWGEAWAWGPYLNGAMRTDEAPRAYAAIRKARELATRHASAREEALIDALSVRYVQDYNRDMQARRDTAYAEAMGRVHKTYLNDLDIAALYGEALFLLEPRRGTRDLDDPDVIRLHDVLESVLAEDVMHPGACHLYIHATESTEEPGKAEECAEFLGESIPGASHINHMPSHTWSEVGRWGDAVRANIRARHTDMKAAVGKGFAIYPSHNLHMLLFAASMDGQGAIAMQAGRDYARMTGNNMYEVLTLLRFGRFDEILEVQERPEHALQRGLWDFAQGYARLRKGEADFARLYLKRVLSAADTSGPGFRFHSAEDLLGTVGGILEGEIHRTEGDLEAAISSFERAVDIEDRLTYDEPEPLPFSARHWLGDALLEAEAYAEAERVYREELADHPNNGWSLYGLAEALRAQDKPVEEIDAQFDESWSRSDTWLRGSVF